MIRKFCLSSATLFALFFLVSTQAFAADIKFTPQVPIPVQSPDTTFDYTKKQATDFTNVQDTRPIADYIKTLFKYLTGIAGILATVFMMVGGVIWLTAAGSPDRISTAKTYITSSITGLLLTFGTYMLLATINTDLVNLKTTSIRQVKKAPDQTDMSSCEQKCGGKEKMTYSPFTEPKCQCLGAGQKGGCAYNKDANGNIYGFKCVPQDSNLPVIGDCVTAYDCEKYTAQKFVWCCQKNPILGSTKCQTFIGTTMNDDSCKSSGFDKAYQGFCSSLSGYCESGPGSYY